MRFSCISPAQQSRDLVRRCVSLEESLRHANDPLFVDLLRRMLCLDADARITASGALDHPWFRM
jgi:serine/threonine protein kinase